MGNHKIQEPNFKHAILKEMKNLVLMQQVHGNNVVFVEKKDIETTIPNCDAMITNDPCVVLGVRVADCLPISIIDEKGRGIGLIHAGWRGLENKIIVKAIELMNTKLKIKNEELRINIGPHICKKHYEVKTDVASKFSDYSEAFKQTPFKDRILKGSRIFLDLAEVARQRFVKLGVKNENIQIDPTCTFENEKLFSYRRDHTEKRNLFLLKI